MSQLDILKDQMQAMDNKIEHIRHDMTDLEDIVNELRFKKNEIEKELEIAENRLSGLSNNLNYLTEVHNETMINYNQIENAATTLLDIIKSKCDNIS